MDIERILTPKGRGDASQQARGTGTITAKAVEPKDLDQQRKRRRQYPQQFSQGNYTEKAVLDEELKAPERKDVSGVSVVV